MMCYNLIDIAHTDFMVNRALLLSNLFALLIMGYLFFFKGKHLSTVLFEREAFGIAAKAVALDESPYKLIIVNSLGKIAEINNKSGKRFGYANDELIEQEPTLLFSNGGKKLIGDLIEQFKDTLRINTEIEVDCLTKTGNKFPARVTLVSKKIINREIFCLIGIQDISAERDKLKACDEKIRLLDLGEEIGEYGSWYWDLITDQVLISNGFKKIFDADKEVYPASDLMRFVYIEDRKAVQDKIEQCVLNGENYTVHYRKRNFNNETVNILCKGAPVKNDTGKTVAVYGFIKTEHESNGSTSKGNV